MASCRLEKPYMLLFSVTYSNIAYGLYESWIQWSDHCYAFCSIYFKYAQGCSSTGVASSPKKRIKKNWVIIIMIALTDCCWKGAHNFAPADLVLITFLLLCDIAGIHQIQNLKHSQLWASNRTSLGLLMFQ